MEPTMDCEISAIREFSCALCGEPFSSRAHVHECLRDQLDPVRYVELFWDEA